MYYTLSIEFLFLLQCFFEQLEEMGLFKPSKPTFYNENFPQIKRSRSCLIQQISNEIGLRKRSKVLKGVFTDRKFLRKSQEDRRGPERLFEV
jgi:hypothetical protein